MSRGPSIITIGSLNKRLLFPVFTGLTHVMIRMGNFILNEKTKEKNHPVILNCVMFFAEFLTIILFFIELYRSKSKNKPHKKIQKKTIFKVCGLLFLISVLEYCASLALKIIRSNNTFLELIFKLIVMGLTAVLSTFILHMKYYVHHVIGFIIILIGLLAYGLLEYKQKTEENSGKTKLSFLEYFVLLLIYSVSALFGNIEKYLMQVEYVSSYLVVAGEGFFGLIVSGFAFLFFKGICPNSKENCPNDQEGPYYNLCFDSSDYWKNFKKYFENSTVTCGFTLYLVGVFWFDTFKMKTTQSYTPTHRSIGDNLSGIIFWIMQLTINWFHSDSKNPTPAIIVFQGISYLIMSIGIMLFLELIIVNVCEMNRNTVDNINIRVYKENEQMNHLEAFNSETFEESESDSFEI